MRIFFFLWLCLFNHTEIRSADYVYFNGGVKNIYNSILNMEFNEASRLLLNEENDNNNFAYLLMKNELDFYEIFISEDILLFDQRKVSKNLRLKKIKNSSLPDEWKSFLIAEILLQWALIELKLGSVFVAFSEIRRAIILLEEIKTAKPEFIYTYKSLGVLHSLIGTIPEGFSWVKSLIHLEGTISLGKNETKKFFEFAKLRKDIFYLESVAANAFIVSFLENNPEEGFLFWSKSSDVTQANPLNALVGAKLAMKSSKNDEALKILSFVIETKMEKLPYLFFLDGLTKLQQLNLAAENDFKKYLNHFHGNSYLKETYQKLSWCALLKKDTTLYKFYLSKIGENGNNITDEDRQAQNDFLKNEIPDFILLKCRLLFDGGYSNRSLKLLEPRVASYYKNPKLKTECAYRMGRILQSQKEFKGALLYFNDVVQSDPKFKTFYSSAALLYSGHIWEKLGDYNKSCQAYRNTLKTKPEQYSRSIHQKAKTGIIRLGSCI